MIHLIENGRITQSWQSLPKSVVRSDGERIHAQHEQRSYGWEHLESKGLFRELTQSVTLGENEYISGYDGPVVIDGKPVRVPVVATKTQEQLDAELQAWRENVSVRTAAARIILAQNGLLNQVQAIIDGLPEPDKTAAQIQWEYEVNIKRLHPLVVSLTPLLGLAETQLDDLFRAAEAI